MEQRPLLFLALPGLICIFLGLVIGSFTLQSFNLTGFFQIPEMIAVLVLVVGGAILVVAGMLLFIIQRIMNRSK